MRLIKITFGNHYRDSLDLFFIRPVSLFPFPYEAVRKAAQTAKAVLVVELSTGQMIEDVDLALRATRPLHFYGRQGGILASPDGVADEVRKIVKDLNKKSGRRR